MHIPPCIDIVAFEASGDDQPRHSSFLPHDEHGQMIERIDTIRYLQSVLPRYDPPLLSPLQPFTQLLRVLVVPVDTISGHLLGELEADDLSALVGLQQRLPAVAVAHGWSYDVIAR